MWAHIMCQARTAGIHRGVAKSKSPGFAGCWHCGPMNLGRWTDEGVRPYMKQNRKSVSGGDAAVFLQPLLSPWYSVSRNECISGASYSYGLILRPNSRQRSDRNEKACSVAVLGNVVAVSGAGGGGAESQLQQRSGLASHLR